MFLIQGFLQVYVHSVFLVPPSCRGQGRSQHRSPRGPLEGPVPSSDPYPFKATPGLYLLSCFSLDPETNMPRSGWGEPTSRPPSFPHTQIIRLPAMPVLHVPH